ncbi:MAG: MarR family transcriptional regulator [Planctomycetes bacterium]|nr:MarR family transcriptional regulator [Planctomycetota bacterium]
MPSQPGPEVPAGEKELTILQSLRRIIRAVDIHSRKLVTQYGITGPQLVCLVTLCDEGAMTSAELSRRVFVSASTITGIIDRLERAGYVVRQRDEIDRRRVLLQPTDTGFKLAYRAPSPIQEQLVERLHELPELERSAIAMSLQRIVDLMEARSVDASPMLATGDIHAGASARLEAADAGDNPDNVEKN